jgi:hypothetical protein
MSRRRRTKREVNNMARSKIAVFWNVMPWILKLEEAGSYETLVPIPILHGATSPFAGFAMWMTLLHLATWSRQAEWIPEPPNKHPLEHSVHHGDQKGGPSPLPGQRYLYETKSSLGHSVYRKPTHTNLHPNTKSHQHPSYKQAVLSTLVHRALCNEDSLRAELVFLRGVFRQNGYKDWQIHNVLNYRPNISKPDNKPSSVASLPYAGPIFGRIGTVLVQYNIE